jgi:hypothetical protein
MTVVCLLCDPPRPGVVFERLVETSPLSASEAADLYAAACRDVAAAVEGSGGELLVNYRSGDSLPPDERGGDAEAALREAIEPALDDPDEARFEVQVGETFAGRAGNTITHLLEEEEATTAAAVEPSSALLSRPLIDTAAMKLRRHPVVLGPATDGRVHYAGFREPIDFEDAYVPPAVTTLVERARSAGLETDFLEYLPVIETGPDLAEVLALVRAREEAGRNVPEHTAAWFADADLELVAGTAGLELVR